MFTCSNTKPTQALLATFITFFILLSKVNSSDDISFNFKKFVQNQEDLIIQGNASISETGVLRLTKVENGEPIAMSVGIAEYVSPIHIWEKERVASFVTTFSFIMEAPNPNLVSDGLTFFLAPLDFPQGRNGGYFGLFNGTQYDSSYQIVAVEFDTHGAPEDQWDPPYQHIGIDVNSVTSETTVQWDAKYGGIVANVEIRYEASTKTLTATLIYPSDQTSYIVSSSVDLKAILPEWVRVGFTATDVSTWRETHDVLNWSFASTLENDITLDNNARFIA
ncbi:hypothetical protein TanjilG_22582 [Lupinus angustifolius]|uniref:Legume lectin domain-containing protein n=1 Tax=Lupinus angustifolius TaxID=3871 RepID=A0A4P1RST5_LUPAN|nr:PREDICTED: anti-H(O) lectin 1-like [Lupinus angustifolius]OIW17470.1 hypothetical protein TanjilG_22582 [Lupinus angustifolius]